MGCFFLPESLEVRRQWANKPPDRQGRSHSKGFEARRQRLPQCGCVRLRCQNVLLLEHLGQLLQRFRAVTPVDLPRYAFHCPATAAAVDYLGQRESQLLVRVAAAKERQPQQLAESGQPVQEVFFIRRIPRLLGGGLAYAAHIYDCASLLCLAAPPGLDLVLRETLDDPRVEAELLSNVVDGVFLSVGSMGNVQ